MVPCSFCGSKIVIGGVKDGSRHFCNDTCHQKGADATVAQLVPPEEVAIRVWEMHRSACPKCHGPGPLDIHTSHEIWSAILITSYKSVPSLCCLSCGRKAKAMASLGCFFLGWWGFPMGLLLTPVQLVRNLWGLATVKTGAKPSAELEQIARLILASEIHEAQKQGLLPPSLS